MKSKIHLYWFKYKLGCGNFGDELNPYIFSKLTNLPIEHININLLWNSKYAAIINLSKMLYKKKITLTICLKYLYFNILKKPKICLGIGSVLQSCHYNNTVIWGSGIISSKSSVPNGQYVAVRGYKTINRIKELGYNPPKTIGDPALLLPRIYKPKVKKEFLIGIIPHYTHHKDTINNFSDPSICIINMLNPIEKVITEINKCNLTISTSLHGIIVSHAYGIESIRATHSTKKLYGDNIKFSDYFSSIAIAPYTPIDIASLYKMEVSDILKIVKEAAKKEALMPKPFVINKIQANLIHSFPYKIKKNVFDYTYKI